MLLCSHRDETSRHSRGGNRILLEQPSNERRIKVGSDFHDHRVSESAQPAVSVVKPEPVLCDCFGMNFPSAQSSLISTCAACSWAPCGRTCASLSNVSARNSVFRVIVPGERVRALDNPVDIVGDMLEEPFAITRFEIPKDLANIGGGQPLRIRNGGHMYLAMGGLTRASRWI